MTDSPKAPWHAEHRQVFDFARILAATGVLATATDALDYLAEPERLDTEHTLWTQLAHPQPPSTDELAEARLLGLTSPRAIALRRQHQSATDTWETFCILLDELHSTGRPLRPVAANCTELARCSED
ncbi:hypothetical protein [Mycolicibacterium tusciae]|uniref:hypothetical protein n=1 Tax=Mycolicibacterium tusciae TaxID=75922 RepID=UPI00024A4FB4|nr:hypothetical protein [Mycolicibacterium tusciae]